MRAKQKVIHAIDVQCYLVLCAATDELVFASFVRAPPSQAYRLSLQTGEAAQIALSPIGGLNGATYYQGKVWV